MTRPPVGNREDYQSLDGLAVAREGSAGSGSTAGGMGNGPGSRRVLVHASGFRQSPYADIKPPGDDAASAARKAAREPKPPRKLWHTSPGSPG
jgi:error-prone DNA polymerase